MTLSFIADVHLGKLTRMLRMLGFDVLYNNEVTRQQLVVAAQSQNRILLSRYAPLAAELPGRAFIVHSPYPEVQLQQIVQQLQLAGQLRPFTRCMVCNGSLQPCSIKCMLNIHNTRNSAYILIPFHAHAGNLGNQRQAQCHRCCC